MTGPGANFLELHRASFSRAEPPVPSRVEEVSLRLPRDRFTVIAGDELAGKDALFRLLTLAEPPTSGDLHVDGESTAAWTPETRSALRTGNLAVLFSGGFLLPSLSALENVAMPVLKRTQAGPDEVRAQVEQLLQFVGMSGGEQILVGHLRPGDQFRVALARALGQEPRLLVAEELDRNLYGADLEYAAMLLKRACGEFGVTVVATVSRCFPREWADLAYLLEDGRVVPEATWAGQSSS